MLTNNEVLDFTNDDEGTCFSIGYDIYDEFFPKKIEEEDVHECTTHNELNLNEQYFHHEDELNDIIKSDVRTDFQRIIQQPRRVSHLQEEKQTDEILTNNYDGAAIMYNKEMNKPSEKMTCKSNLPPKIQGIKGFLESNSSTSQVKEQSYEQQNIPICQQLQALSHSMDRTQESKRLIGEMLTGNFKLLTKTRDTELFVECNLTASYKTPQIPSQKHIYERQRLQNLLHNMNETQKTQRLIQTWDKKMGLKRSHSSTMTKSRKSRQMISRMLLEPIGAGQLEDQHVKIKEKRRRIKANVQTLICGGSNNDFEI
mmetsp:Transcript_18271/g.23227  ORF Transcript_18271/g.23227 Transcript_18271/m.23227 type:complete len:313 (-) Transcript_18271:500-1438(-)